MMLSMTPDTDAQHDAIAIGGSFRRGVCRHPHRSVHGGRSASSMPEIRNRFAEASHGFFANDGTDPRVMIANARHNSGSIRPRGSSPARLSTPSRSKTAPRVVLDGGEVLRARKLVLAFGLSDVLPDLPGLAQRWARACCIARIATASNMRGAPRRASGRPFSAHKALLIAE